MPPSRKELRVRAQRRADLEGSKFISDDEWNDYLGEGVAELHEFVTNKNEDYIVKSKDISIVANTVAYALPDDFLKRCQMSH